MHSCIRLAIFFSGQFRAADRLREQLEREGVRIDDKARIWSTGDGRRGAIAASSVPYTQGVGSLLEAELNGALGLRKPPPAAAAARRNNNDNNNNFDRASSSSAGGPASGNRRDDRPSSRSSDSRKRSFGPNGHDYRQVGDLQTDLHGPPVDQVDSLLAARLNAKLAKDYDAADRIKVWVLGAGSRIHTLTNCMI